VITDICRGWANGTMNIYGILLKYASGSDSLLHFNSSEAGSNPPDFYVTYAVTLSRFVVLPGSFEVRLEWTSEVEDDNAGFNVLRATSPGGPFDPVNDHLLQGGQRDYSFVDTGLSNGTRYYYQLEDIDLTGWSTVHGPRSAVPLDADLDRSGAVDRDDLLHLARSVFWDLGAPDYSATADIDQNGIVDQGDILPFLVRYDLTIHGITPHEVDLTAATPDRLGELDLNRDGRVTRDDAELLLRSYGASSEVRDIAPYGDLDGSGRVERVDVELYFAIQAAGEQPLAVTESRPLAAE
jgi:hypothetical protein